MADTNGIYQMITDKIIKGLEKGRIPWRKSWKGNDSDFTAPINFSSKKAYRGINVLILWYSMVNNNFKSPYFLTFKQVNALGGQVIKGSKSELIVYWNIGKRNTNEFTPDGKRITKPFFILKHYRVFNIEQTKGIKYPKPEEIKPVATFKQIEQAENFINSFKDKPVIEHIGNSACYSPAMDVIKMPNKENFVSNSEYYGTLFHELTHSTGHKKRLKRKELIEPAIFGDPIYSQEELTAEIGTAFICGITGISNAKLEENQQAYINGWIEKLRNDPKCIIYASAKAQKAVDYMQGKKYQEVEQEEKKETVTV